MKFLEGLTLKSIAPVVVGVLVAGLILNFGKRQPILKEAHEGLGG